MFLAVATGKSKPGMSRNHGLYIPGDDFLDGLSLDAKYRNALRYASLMVPTPLLNLVRIIDLDGGSMMIDICDKHAAIEAE